jgi:hypothetical protein
LFNTLLGQNLQKRLDHIALGLEREISDEEEEEEEVSVYEYETELDDLIDEYDKDYLEFLENEEAVRADPADDDPPPSDKSRVTGYRKYDQLRQEDEILGGGGH